LAYSLNSTILSKLVGYNFYYVLPVLSAPKQELKIQDFSQ